MSAELPLEPKKAITTADVNQMIWNRYTERGEHVVLFNVPNVVGINSRRYCDAVVIGMWKSSGQLIQGFEIKASRSDWLRELKDVTKSDPFMEQCDRWWLATTDASIAKPDEIPHAWGWMTATRNGLRIQKPAPPLPQHETMMKRLWAFALIRRAFERGSMGSPEFVAMRRELEERKDREVKEAIARAEAGINPRFEELKRLVERFEQDSGMRLDDWRLGNVGKLARAIHEASAGGFRSYRDTLSRQIKTLGDLSEKLQAALDATESPAGELTERE